MSRNKIVFLLSTILLLLSACQSGIIATGEATNTFAASATNTPTPTETIKPTATPDTITYEIPDWLQDTENNVLLFVTTFENSYNKYHLITFLEPETGNTYEIDYFMDFHIAFWLDNQQVAFLHGESCKSFYAGSILDLTTGVVAKYLPEELADDGFCPYQIPTYSVSVDRTEENPVEIYYWESGEWEEFIPQNSGTVNLNAELSPDEDLLVVLQNSTGSYFSGDQLAIFDFLSRKQVATFYDTDINNFFHFFSDSKRIVYLKGNTPCIMTLETLEKECGQTIPEFHENIYLGGLTKDENSITFISDNMENVKRICIEDISTDNKRCDLMDIEGGLCIFDIFNGDIHCPTSGFDGIVSKTRIIDNSLGIKQPVTNWYSVIRYVFSPDENFIVFTHGIGCPDFCHAFNKLFRSVISIDGSVYYDLGEHNHIFSWAEWRPLP